MTVFRPVCQKNICSRGEEDGRNPGLVNFSPGDTCTVRHKVARNPTNYKHLQISCFNLKLGTESPDHVAIRASVAMAIRAKVALVMQ